MFYVANFVAIGWLHQCPKVEIFCVDHPYSCNDQFIYFFKLNTYLLY